MVKHSKKCLLCLLSTYLNIWVFEGSWILTNVTFLQRLDHFVIKGSSKIFLGFKEKSIFLVKLKKNQFPNNNVWNWCWLFYAANGLLVQVIDIKSPTKRWAVIWHAITDFWLFLPHYLKKKHCFWFEIKNQEKEQKNLVPKIFCSVLTR